MQQSMLTDGGSPLEGEVDSPKTVNSHDQFGANVEAEITAGEESVPTLADQESASKLVRERTATIGYDVPLTSLTDLKVGDGVYWHSRPRTAQPLVALEETDESEGKIKLLGTKGGEYTLNYCEEGFVIASRFGRLLHPRQIKPPKSGADPQTVKLLEKAGTDSAEGS